MAAGRARPARRWMVTVNDGAECFPDIGLPADHDAAWVRFRDGVLGRAKDSGRRGIDVLYVGGQFERGGAAAAAGADDEHLQVYLHVGRPVRFTQAARLVPGAHVEAAIGRAEQCIAYCSKEESRIAGPYSHGDAGALGQGSRNDVADAVAAIAGGADIGKWVIEHPSALKLWSSLEKLRASTFKPRSSEAAPNVTWCWGGTGTGKSKWAAEQAPQDDTYWKPSNPKWWDGYAQQSVCIIDDYRPKDGLSFKEMLNLLDRYPFPIEIKGTYTQFNTPHIIITTPCTPQDTFAGHTDEDIAQLLRRITTIKHFE